MSAQQANSDRSKQPLLDDLFYVGLLLRRAGAVRHTALKAGTTANDKIVAEIGWMTADALMAVKRSQPPKSKAFLACFETSKTAKHLPLEAAFEMFRQTLQRVSQEMTAICGSKVTITSDAGTEEVCRTALLLLEELKAAHDAGKLGGDNQPKPPTTNISEDEIEHRIQALQEREEFIQKMEERLMSKAQEQQEREMMLDQRAEDLAARASRMPAAQNTTTNDQQQGDGSQIEPDINAGTIFEGRERAPIGVNEFRE